MGNSVGADADARRYREGYPDDHEDDTSMRANIDFFENKIASRPRGDYITNIHKNWFADYRELEVNHAYIQWLFPIREEGMNFQSQRIQPHEIKYIRKRPALQKRLIKSYEMMLDFYGMEIANYDTGEIKRAEHWKPRYRHLSNSFHNYLRITRILKCLGELGYEKYKAPLVEHILNEIKNHRLLIPCFRSCADYWIPVIRGDAERDRLASIAKELVDSGIVSHRSRDAYRRRRRSPSPERVSSGFKPLKRGTRVFAKWQAKEFRGDVVGWDKERACYKVRADGETKWFRAKPDDVRLLNPPKKTTVEDPDEDKEGAADMEDSQPPEDADEESGGGGDSMDVAEEGASGASSSSSPGARAASSSPRKSPSESRGASEEATSSDDAESKPKALKQQKIEKFFEKK